MTIIIPISIFGFCVLASVGLYLMLARPQDVAGKRLRQLRNQDGDAEDSPMESSVAVFAQKVAQPINRVLPPNPAEMSKLQKKLMYAGFRSPNAPVIYRAIQVISLVFFPAFSLLQATIINTGYFKPGLSSIMFGLFTGYMAPRKYLDYLVNKRQLHLRWGVADALDLLVISVEAGLGVNQAMQRISQELKYAHPEISEEFEMVNTEIRVGREREEALRNLAERTGIDDLRGLCAMLIQADRFGTSIARAVRVYSDSLRTRRRQRAEHEAQKAAMKMLIPLAIFLFPTLFIALLGPAVLQLTDNFK
jgi:tight adherence protein C